MGNLLKLLYKCLLKLNCNENLEKVPKLQCSKGKKPYIYHNTDSVACCVRIVTIGTHDIVSNPCYTCLYNL